MDRINDFLSNDEDANSPQDSNRPLPPLLTSPLNERGITSENADDFFDAIAEDQFDELSSAGHSDIGEDAIERMIQSPPERAPRVRRELPNEITGKSHKTF